MTKGQHVFTWCLVIACFVSAFVLDDVVEQRDAYREENAYLSTLYDSAKAEVQALQDSVLAGEIEGFGLRCYFVKEEGQ